MSIASLPRIVPLTLVLALLVVAPARAQLPAALGPDGRVFTLLGAGDETPREGLAVHRLRSLRGDLAPLPGGELALVGGRPRLPWVAGLDGRLHALPPVPQLMMVASAPDGTLVAQSGDEQILRLREDRSAWEPLLDAAAAIPRWDGRDELAVLAALPGGGAVFTTADTTVWRVLPGAAPAALAMPEQTEATAVAPLPGGELLVAVEDSGGETTLMVAPAGDGPFRRLSRLSPAPSFGLAVGPAGTLLRASGALDLLDADGELVQRIDRRGRVGTGDGGPSAGARLFALGVAAGDDGAVLAREITATGWTRVLGRDPFDSWLFSAFVGPGAPRAPLRVFSAPGSARALAAVAPPTYRTLRDGAVAVESTIAGRATVVVREAGEERARAQADVPAGRSVIALPTPPPAADLLVELELVTADGRVAGSRARISTRTRLAGRTARRLARRTGRLVSFTSDDRFSTGACRRRDALRVVCEVQGAAGGCRGRATLAQRPDGRLVRLRAGRRHCPGA